MILTEADLRELWQNGRQPLPAFAPGTRLSPAAQDFLKDHQLTLQIASAPPAAPPAAAALPAPLPARLDALRAWAALAAAQARHFRLPALAVRLDGLADAIAQWPAGPAHLPASGPAALLSNANPPPFTPNHPILRWLRLLHTEAAAAAALARETTAPPGLPVQLEACAAALLDLERRFLSGELAWPVGP